MAAFLLHAFLLHAWIADDGVLDLAGLMGRGEITRSRKGVPAESHIWDMDPLEAVTVTEYGEEKVDRNLWLAGDRGPPEPVTRLE